MFPSGSGHRRWGNQAGAVTSLLRSIPDIGIVNGDCGGWGGGGGGGGGRGVGGGVGREEKEVKEGTIVATIQYRRGRESDAECASVTANNRTIDGEWQLNFCFPAIRELVE